MADDTHDSGNQNRDSSMERAGDRIDGLGTNPLEQEIKDALGQSRSGNKLPDDSESLPPIYEQPATEQTDDSEIPGYELRNKNARATAAYNDRVRIQKERMQSAREETVPKPRGSTLLDGIKSIGSNITNKFGRNRETSENTESPGFFKGVYQSAQSSFMNRRDERAPTDSPTIHPIKERKWIPRTLIAGGLGAAVLLGAGGAGLGIYNHDQLRNTAPQVSTTQTRAAPALHSVAVVTVAQGKSGPQDEQTGTRGTGSQLEEVVEAAERVGIQTGTNNDGPRTSNNHITINDSYTVNIPQNWNMDTDEHSTFFTYEVQPGDSLHSIFTKAGVPLEYIGTSSVETTKYDDTLANRRDDQSIVQVTQPTQTEDGTIQKADCEDGAADELYAGDILKLRLSSKEGKLPQGTLLEGIITDCDECEGNARSASAQPYDANVQSQETQTTMSSTAQVDEKSSPGKAPSVYDRPVHQPVQEAETQNKSPVHNGPFVTDAIGAKPDCLELNGPYTAKKIISEGEPITVVSGVYDTSGNLLILKQEYENSNGEIGTYIGGTFLADTDGDQTIDMHANATMQNVRNISAERFALDQLNAFATADDPKEGLVPFTNQSDVDAAYKSALYFMNQLQAEGCPDTASAAVPNNISCPSQVIQALSDNEMQWLSKHYSGGNGSQNGVEMKEVTTGDVTWAAGTIAGTHRTHAFTDEKINGVHHSTVYIDEDNDGEVDLVGTATYNTGRNIFVNEGRNARKHAVESALREPTESELHTYEQMVQSLATFAISKGVDLETICDEPTQTVSQPAPTAKPVTPVTESEGPAYTQGPVPKVQDRLEEEVIQVPGTKPAPAHLVLKPATSNNAEIIYDASIGATNVTIENTLQNGSGRVHEADVAFTGSQVQAGVTRNTPKNTISARITGVNASQDDGRQFYTSQQGDELRTFGVNVSGAQQIFTSDTLFPPLDSPAYVAVGATISYVNIDAPSVQDQQNWLASSELLGGLGKYNGDFIEAGLGLSGQRITMQNGFGNVDVDNATEVVPYVVARFNNDFGNDDRFYAKGESRVFFGAKSLSSTDEFELQSGNGVSVDFEIGRYFGSRKQGSFGLFLDMDANNNTYNMNEGNFTLEDAFRQSTVGLRATYTPEK